MVSKAVLFVGIPDDLKKEFYDVIREVWGYDRTNLRKATAEAITDWINKKRLEKEVKPRAE